MTQITLFLEEDIEAFKKLLNETYLDPNMVIV